MTTVNNNPLTLRSMASTIKDIIRDGLEEARKEELTLEDDSKEILEKICSEMESFFSNQLDGRSY